MVKGLEAQSSAPAPLNASVQIDRGLPGPSPLEACGSPLLQQGELGFQAERIEQDYSPLASAAGSKSSTLAKRRSPPAEAEDSHRFQLPSKSLGA
jgi:hypothetical protein